MPGFRAIVLSLGLIATPVLAAPDGAFLTDAMKGDNSEVALGRLAQHAGASPRTRAYGAMLVRDHGAHKMKVAALARSANIRPTNALSDDGMKAKMMLMKLRGDRFDAAFKHHMIEDHRGDIAKYEAQMRETRNPRVRALTRDTLPTLHRHLDGANAL